ncbi:MAG: 50S ribosomal protein L28 [Planctomycetes bacterium]|nr:50S ribosomal protein L28 [Planctomycetota bacterium]
MCSTRRVALLAEIRAVPFQCLYCDKKTQVGNTVARRGLPKKVGGIGLKTTGIRRRTFKPNLQKVHAIVDGKYTRVLVCTRCIKAGRVIKQLKQKKPVAAV